MNIISTIATPGIAQFGLLGKFNMMMHGNIGRNIHTIRSSASHCLGLPQCIVCQVAQRSTVAFELIYHGYTFFFPKNVSVVGVSIWSQVIAVQMVSGLQPAQGCNLVPGAFCSFVAPEPI